MGHTSSIVSGLAELLAAEGLGVYRPAGVYAPDEIAIFLHRMPEAPDKAFAITPYPVEDTGLTDVTDGLQIRMRAGPDPREVLDMADAVRDLLHMREGTVVGGVRLSLIWRQSQAPMGQDEHGREELTSNYYARSTRPSPHVYE
ncbi:minor capsid protein [Streptomyces sp. Je 1-369]|uniref:minor capsid protein n=1 Tax=Streptomyces sp. Je 1-369 TaxID=2966192 RepID=UPI002285624B|nr:minor capsid protein [Streptomyces sp. Je 1-369]WAL94000.1 minor capsid protein [Streptomyces sp. Je 1-369]